MNQTTKRLSRIIRSFPGHTIGVLGDFMLDELLRGDATRISPEAPVPVVLMKDDRRDGFPGGAGNVCANIAALGARAVPFGAIGTDKSGKRLQELLKGVGVSCETLVEEPGRVTPRKVRIVAHQQQLLRLDFEKPYPISSGTVRSLVRRFRRWAGRLDALIVSDYLKGSATTDLCGHFSIVARERGVPVFVDPKPEHPEACHGATAITPNLHEAERLAGLPLRDCAQRALGGPKLVEELRCSALLITRGGEGMTLVESGGAVHEIDSISRPVYDVTGAGDTVIAVVALAYGSGASLRESAELANLAGGRVVLKFGTAGITARELLQAVRERGR
jgi:D-beta-D-heptose 7-phosphate kinase/D-beta-D-heptose 1-phosphate adenosyltransferase